MTCTYDGLSRRREKVEFTESGAITTRYMYIEHHRAGWFPLMVDISGPGTNEVLELYTHGPDLSGTLGGAGGIGGILSCHGGTGSTPSYYHYDGNGNVIALTDTNGAVISRLDYAPFGTVLTSSGPTPRFQWSSKEWDGVVGLNYHGHRYYPPALGRWLSRDPLGEKESAVLYIAFANAPVGVVDPLGMRPECTPWERGPCVEKGRRLVGVQEKEDEPTCSNMICWTGWGGFQGWCAWCLQYCLAARWKETIYDVLKDCLYSRSCTECGRVWQETTWQEIQESDVQWQSLGYRSFTRVALVCSGEPAAPAK